MQDYDYEYYLKLSTQDGRRFNGHILSTINLRGLIAEGKWIYEDDNILTNPEIEAILVLKDGSP